MYGQYNKITEKSLCYKDNMLCFLCIFRNLLIYSPNLIFTAKAAYYMREMSPIPIEEPRRAADSGGDRGYHAP